MGYFHTVYCIQHRPDYIYHFWKYVPKYKTGKTQSHVSMASSFKPLAARVGQRCIRPGPFCDPLRRSFSTRYVLRREQGNPSPRTQSSSPLAPIGVNAALQAATNPEFTPRPKIFDEFSLKDRVGVVSGANRGLGLEMALVLAEMGARAVYCLDLPPEPSEEWKKTCDYVRRMGNESKLEYVSADVRDQRLIWDIVKVIGDREKRMDVCIAAAGVLKAHTDCLHYPAEQFKEVC